MNLLLTGAAGYVGSHVAHRLAAEGHSLTVIDNLHSGFDWAIPSSAIFVRGDVRDITFLRGIMKTQSFHAVLHFAALTQVGESVLEPLRYYDVNTVGTLRLLQAMKEAKIHKFVFSSTAAVYRDSDQIVSEDAELAPVSPYGQSKLFAEKAMRDLAASDGDFRYVGLRYFNVAGAHPDGFIGQATLNATHLIKVACEAACGKRSELEIYGDDYNTPDGTCVRDFIHVWDLAEAHLLALNYLMSGKAVSQFLNVGYGHGYSVKEVIAAVEKMSGRRLNVKIGKRRAGDIPSVIADSKKIIDVIGFRPRFNNLETICETALRFEKKMTERS